MQSDNNNKLSQEKILEILRKTENTEEVELLDSNLGPGTEQGANFAGLVLACTITAQVNKEEKEYNWMIKLQNEDSNRKMVNRAIRVDEKEVDMYGRVIPAWKSLVKDRNAATEDVMPNFCKIYHSEFHQDVELGSLLVMENMCSMDYQDAVEKRKGLHLGYSKLVLEELAKFHALGYAYMKSYPGGIAEGLKQNEMLTRDYFMAFPEDLVKNTFHKMLEASIPTLIERLELVQEPGQDFAGFFEKFHKKNDSFAYQQKLFKPNPNGFNTLCHGDAWFNNMLFKHEKLADGSLNPIKACLIDLTTMRWASPCTDLSFFLFLSTTPQLRRTHMEDMLGHYHDTLVRTLHKLGEDPTVYPYRSLVNDYDRYCYIGFYAALGILPMIICKKEDSLTEEEMKGDWGSEENQAKMKAKTKLAFVNEPQIKLRLAGNFMEMLDRGIFG